MLQTLLLIVCKSKKLYSYPQSLTKSVRGGRVGDNKLNKHPIILAPLISLFLNMFPPSNNENEGRQLLRQIASIIKDKKATLTMTDAKDVLAFLSTISFKIFFN